MHLVFAQLVYVLIAYLCCTVFHRIYIQFDATVSGFLVHWLNETQIKTLLVDIYGNV